MNAAEIFRAAERLPMTNARYGLTQERLKSLLSYSPETGVFIWLQAKRKSRVGAVAGCLAACGYRLIRIDGLLHRANRLAVLYMTGAHPQANVDHIDGVRSNDAWANLRDVPQSVNAQNIKRPQRNNKLGILGVCWCKKSKKYKAQIKVESNRVVGYYTCPLEAGAAYLAAKREFHEGSTL